MRPPADDPGLARERTALAWLRIAATQATLGAMIAAGAARHGELWCYLAAIATVVLNATVLLWCAVSASRGRLAAGSHAATVGPAAVVGATTALAGAVAVLLTLIALR